jgi:hypothetical protein
MPISVETSIQVTEYPSHNDERLQEIETLAAGLDCTKLRGIGTLAEYNVLIEKAREVQLHMEALEIPKLHGLDTLTSGIHAMIGQLQDLNFDFHFEVEVDDTKLLEQVKQFLSAVTTLEAKIQTFSVQLKISGAIRMPDSIKQIRTVVATLEPLIECAKEAVHKFNNSSTISEETKTAIKSLNDIVQSVDGMMEDIRTLDTGQCRSLSRGKIEGWKLAFCITLPVLIVISTAICIAVWMWRKNSR